MQVNLFGEVRDSVVYDHDDENEPDKLHPLAHPLTGDNSKHLNRVPPDLTELSTQRD